MYIEVAVTGAVFLYTVCVPRPFYAGRTYSALVLPHRNQPTIALAVRPVVLVFDKYLSFVRSKGHCSPDRYGTTAAG